MKKELMAQIHNKFEIEVIDGETGKIKQKAQAHNTVLNQLWTYLFADSGSSWGTYIHYGSGSGTPSASDTALFTFSGAVGVTEVSLSPNYANSVISRVCRIQLGTSAAVGVTITEVGLAAGSGSSTLTTHAMLQDMNGNPISIAKTDTDIINIYATVYLHWNISDTSFSLCAGAIARFILGANVIYSNNNYNPLREGTFKFYISNSNTGITYASHNIQGDGATVISASRSADTTNKRLTFTATRVDVGTANWHGIRYINVGVSQLGETGLLIRSGQNTWAKTQITGESVGTGDGTTTEFSTKFNFPEDATVYINGNAVAATDVTVKKLPVVNMSVTNRLTGWYDCPLLFLDDASTDARHIYAPATSNSYINGSAYINVSNRIVYNPSYTEGGGISYVSTRDSFTLQTSDDLVTWTTVGSGSNITVPAAHQAKKYYKFVGDTLLYTLTGVTPANIVFNTAPANGDVITIDYKTDSICKDADHVLDFSVTLQFGEYSGE